MPRGWFKSNTKIMPASATNGTINGAGTGVNASSPRGSNITTTGQRITPNNITGNASTNSRSRNSHPNATSTVGFGAGFGAGAVAPPGTIMPSVQSFSAGNANTDSIRIKNRIQSVLHNQAALINLLSQLRKEYPHPKLCEMALSLLRDEQLKYIANRSDAYWRILAHGEILMRWSKTPQNSHKYLSNMIPERSSPDDHINNTKENQKWIYGFLDAAIKENSVKHFVFRGSNEDYREVFTNGFQLGDKDNRNILQYPKIYTGEFSVSSYVTKTTPRSIISTSYSLGIAQGYGKINDRESQVYICVAHRGFDLSSGVHLEVAELGIPDSLILCALQQSKHSQNNHTYYFIINKTFYDRNFMNCFTNVILDYKKKYDKQNLIRQVNIKVCSFNKSSYLPKIAFK